MLSADEQTGDEKGGKKADKELEFSAPAAADEKDELSGGHLLSSLFACT